MKTECVYIMNSQDMKILNNEEQIVITNRATGEWIKISQESYTVLQIYFENNYTIHEFICFLEDKEEVNFVMNLFTALERINIIHPHGENIKYDFPPIISYAITRQCNLRCKHCSYLTDSDEDRISMELSDEQILLLLSNIAEVNPESITITGGEPLLHKSFANVVDYLKNNFSCEKILMTNGTLINEENISQITGCFNKIDISIDGVDEETCSEIRGKGVFKKVINSINLLHKHNYMDISLSMVLVGRNQHLYPEFINLCNDLEVEPLPRHFIALNQGDKNYNYLNQVQPEFENVSVFENPENLDLIANSCKAGTVEFFIDSTGDLYPCPLLVSEDYKIGRIFHDIDFANFILTKEFLHTKSFDAMMKLEPEFHTECKDCKVNQFCNSCPAEMAAYSGKEYQQQRCRHYKEPLYNLLWHSN